MTDRTPADHAATVRHVIAYLAGQSSAADIDGTRPQDTGYAALDALEAQADRAHVLLERLEVEQADHEKWRDAEEQRDAYRVQSEAQASEALKWRNRAEAAQREADIQMGGAEMSAFAEPLAQAREALAIAWPEGDHAEPNAYTEILAALDLIEQRATDMEKALRLAERALLRRGMQHKYLPEEIELDHALRDALAAREEAS